MVRTIQVQLVAEPSLARSALALVLVKMVLGLPAQQDRQASELLLALGLDLGSYCLLMSITHQYTDWDAVILVKRRLLGLGSGDRVRRYQSTLP